MPAQPVALQIEEAAALRNLKLEDLLGLPAGAATEATLLLAAQRLMNIYNQLLTGPVPVDVGANLAVTANFESKVSPGNTTNIPLAANATFTGAWEEVTDYGSITAAVKTDQDSAPNGAVAQFSTDGTDAGIVTMEYATVKGGYPAFFSFTPQARFFRIVYTNGAVAQTDLDSQILYSFQAITPQGPLGSQSDDLSASLSTQSHLKARVMSGPYAGLWMPIGMNPDTGQLQVQDPGSAREVTMAERYGGGKEPATGSRAVAGVSTIVAPALGKRIKTYWVSVIPNPDNSSAVQFVVRYAGVGGAVIYRGFAVSHWETFVGAANAALEIETLGGGEVAWTVHYEEIL